MLRRLKKLICTFLTEYATSPIAEIHFVIKRKFWVTTLDNTLVRHDPRLGSKDYTAQVTDTTDLKRVCINVLLFCVSVTLLGSCSVLFLHYEQTR